MQDTVKSLSYQGVMKQSIQLSEDSSTSATVKGPCKGSATGSANIFKNIASIKSQKQSQSCVKHGIQKKKR